MARATDGSLIDPHGGERDLAARVLRHVSGAFVEDPLRVLRVARFAARFAPLGFTVAPETLALMRRIVADGEMPALVPERVWTETQRALAEREPRTYFEVLRSCGALAAIFPELEALYGVPQPPPVCMPGSRSRPRHSARRMSQCALPRWCTISARR